MCPELNHWLHNIGILYVVAETVVSASAFILNIGNLVLFKFNVTTAWVLCWRDTLDLHNFFDPALFIDFCCEAR